MKINMTTNQLKEFITLFSNLHNNTRLPRNRGFTPNELAQQYGGLKNTQKHIIRSKYNCGSEKR